MGSFWGIVSILLLKVFEVEVQSCSSDKDLYLCKFNDLHRTLEELKDEVKTLKLKQNVDIKQLRLAYEEQIQSMKKDHQKDVAKLKGLHEGKMKQISEELKCLKADVVVQNMTLNQASQITKTLSSNCKMLPSDICGRCTCLDDDRLDTRYYCDCQNLMVKRDCLDHYMCGNQVSGVYKINMNKLKTLQVYCDQESDGGGWTVIQRRINGEVNFYREWLHYKRGFGNLHREFWLGNENIYILTLQSAYPSGAEMRVDMTDWNDTALYAKYNNFLLDNEEANYTLHVNGYSGDCGDSFSYHDKRSFSTYDKDNDNDFRSCAKVFRGGWWYKSCHYSNLNGEYRWKDEPPAGFGRALIWYTYKGYEHSMKSAEIKVRRKAVRMLKEEIVPEPEPEEERGLEEETETASLLEESESLLEETETEQPKAKKKDMLSQTENESGPILRTVPLFVASEETHGDVPLQEDSEIESNSAKSENIILRDAILRRSGSEMLQHGSDNSLQNMMLQNNNNLLLEEEQEENEHADVPLYDEHGRLVTDAMPMQK